MGLTGFIEHIRPINPIYDTQAKKKKSWAGKRKSFKLHHSFDPPRKIPGSAACQEWDL
jgi:hypothetical protein